MKRVIGVVLGLTLLLGMTGPAHAATRTGRSTAVESFWYSTEPLGPNTWRNTVWYVGAFHYKGGSSSDLYVSRDICHGTKRGDVCESESFAVGYIQLTKEQLVLDEHRLEWADIDATYPLQTYDQMGRPVGRPVDTHIVAHLEGAGELQSSHDSYTYEDGHVIITSTFHSYYRDAEATGSVDGTDLGETYTAFMGLNTDSTFKRKA